MFYLTIAICSCLINLGRVLDFSPVFLSTRQIRAFIVTYNKMKMIFEETILYKNKLPPLPLPADAWYNQSQHTQLISSPTSQSKTKYLKNVENFMKVFFYWRGTTNLGIKDFSCFNRIGERTKYKSGGNLSIIDTLHLNFDIFTRGHWRDIDIIRPDLLHFDFSLQQRRICLNLLGCNKFSGNEVIVYGQIILNLFYR